MVESLLAHLAVVKVLTDRALEPCATDLFGSTPVASNLRVNNIRVLDKHALTKVFLPKNRVEDLHRLLFKFLTYEVLYCFARHRLGPLSFFILFVGDLFIELYEGFLGSLPLSIKLLDTLLELVDLHQELDPRVACLSKDSVVGNSKVIAVLNNALFVLRVDIRNCKVTVWELTQIELFLYVADRLLEVLEVCWRLNSLEDGSCI